MNTIFTKINFLLFVLLSFVISCSGGIARTTPYTDEQLTDMGAKFLSGNVTRIGRGAFIVEGKTRFWVGEQTYFEPKDWRPSVGDEVLVSYAIDKSRNNKKLNSALAVKASTINSANIDPENPFIGIVIKKVGTSGKILVSPKGSENSYLFNFQRHSYEPYDNIMMQDETASATLSSISVGDYVKISWHKKIGRMVSHYYISEIELIK